MPISIGSTSYSSYFPQMKPWLYFLSCTYLNCPLENTEIIEDFIIETLGLHKYALITIGCTRFEKFSCCFHRSWSILVLVEIRSQKHCQRPRCCELRFLKGIVFSHYEYVYSYFWKKFAQTSRARQKLSMATFSRLEICDSLKKTILLSRPSSGFMRELVQKSRWYTSSSLSISTLHIVWFTRCASLLRRPKMSRVPKYRSVKTLECSCVLSHVRLAQVLFSMAKKKCLKEITKGPGRFAQQRTLPPYYALAFIWSFTCYSPWVRDAIGRAMLVWQAAQ